MSTIVNFCYPIVVIGVLVTVLESAIADPKESDDVGNQNALIEIAQALAGNGFLEGTEQHQARQRELRHMALSTKIGSTVGVDALVHALSHEDSEVREVATEILADQPNIPADAVDSLATLLDDSSPKTRSNARRCLQTISENAASAFPQLEEFLMTVDKHSFADVLVTMCAVAPTDMKILDILMRTARDESQSVSNRLAAIEMLAQVGSSGNVVLDTLISLREDPELRWHATNGLVRIAPTHSKVKTIVIDDLRRADCLDVTLFSKSCFALDAGDRKAYLDVLEDMLKSDSQMRRVCVASGILRLDRTKNSAREELRTALIDGDGLSWQRALSAVVELRLRIDDRRIIDRLTKAISSTPSASLHPTLVSALGIVGAADDNAIIAILEGLVISESPDVRRAAALALMNVDESRTGRPAVIRYLSDPSNFYRATPTEQILLSREYQASGTLICTLTKMLHSDSHRIQGLRTLSALGGEAEAAIPELVKLLQHPSAEIRQRSLEIIGNTPSQSAKLSELARVLLDDNNILVRWQAHDTLGKAQHQKR